MAVKDYSIHENEIRRELHYLSEAWANMETAKLRVVFNFLISIFMVSAAVYEGHGLEYAVVGATIVQGISFQEIRKAYIQAKQSNRQSTFGED